VSTSLIEDLRITIESDTRLIKQQQAAILALQDDVYLLTDAKEARMQQRSEEREQFGM
jgi:hypothetical protein